MTLVRLRVPLVFLALAVALAGCASGGGPSLTEEARCRQTGGKWQGSYCDAGAGGGGY
jgi:hypothetical protein